MKQSVTLDHFRIDVGEKSFEGGNSPGNSCEPRYCRPRAILENAVQRNNPVASGAESKGVCPCSVCGNHSADRAEFSTRRIDREAKPAFVRGTIYFSSQRAGPDVDTVIVEIDSADRIHSAEVDNHTGSDGSVRHAASRSAWNESERALLRPSNERHYVIGIVRNGDSSRNNSSDSRSFGVHGQRKRVGAVCSAKSRRRQMAARQLLSLINRERSLSADSCCSRKSLCRIFFRTCRR